MEDMGSFSAATSSISDERWKELVHLAENEILFNTAASKESDASNSVPDCSSAASNSSFEYERSNSFQDVGDAFDFLSQSLFSLVPAEYKDSGSNNQSATGLSFNNKDDIQKEEELVGNDVADHLITTEYNDFNWKDGSVKHATDSSKNSLKCGFKQPKKDELQKEETDGEKADLLSQLQEELLTSNLYAGCAYHPVTNYLAPRPQFLAYNPKRSRLRSTHSLQSQKPQYKRGHLPTEKRRWSLSGLLKMFFLNAIMFLWGKYSSNGTGCMTTNFNGELHGPIHVAERNFTGNITNKMSPCFGYFQDFEWLKEQTNDSYSRAEARANWNYKTTEVHSNFMGRKFEVEESVRLDIIEERSRITGSLETGSGTTSAELAESDLTNEISKQNQEVAQESDFTRQIGSIQKYSIKTYDIQIVEGNNNVELVESELTRKISQDLEVEVPLTEVTGHNITGVEVGDRNNEAQLVKPNFISENLFKYEHSVVEVAKEDGAEGRMHKAAAGHFHEEGMTKEDNRRTSIVLKYTETEADEQYNLKVFKLSLLLVILLPSSLQIYIGRRRMLWRNSNTNTELMARASLETNLLPQCGSDQQRKYGQKKIKTKPECRSDEAELSASYGSFICQEEIMVRKGSRKSIAVCAVRRSSRLRHH